MVAGLILFLAAIFIGAWDARNISQASQKMFGSGNLLTLLGSGQLKGSERGRVNMLLVGYSVDDPGHPGASLTDSIILLSMSTTNKTGYMLSIPRDLYVKIPGFGYAKINEAYNDGGLPLLEQVVAADFQIPIDYYALINYASVRETVNALGGISVNIASQDPRGLYDPNISPADGGPLKLPNGVQTLNGQTALNLTRARGDAFGSYGFAQADFDRTQHQRQVLTAIKAKLNWKLILNPRQNSRILNAAASNVKTDISAGEARPLFSLFNSIPSSSLQSLSLRDLGGHNYLTSYTTSYGQSALIPAGGLNDYSSIDAALAGLSQ
jgi:LCP family protein required for cell wall assembly